MADLKILFETAKSDIQIAWNISDKKRRFNRDWIYGVDPETMEFVETVFHAMPGHYSLYTTFTRIMKVNNFNQLLNA